MNNAVDISFECYDAATEDDEPVLIIDADDADSFTGSAREGGTTYWWQVRATAPVNSKWSEVGEFTTLPATMTIDADQFGPAIDATNVPRPW